MASKTYTLLLEGRLDFSQPEQGVKRYVADTKRGMAEAGRAWDGLSAHMRGHASVIATASTALKGYFAIMAAQAGPRALANMVDTWTNIGNRLRLVTSNAKDLAAAQNDVFNTATQTHQPLEATAELYQRIAQNAGKLHLTQKQTASVVGTISKAVALSGVYAVTAEQGINGGTGKPADFIHHDAAGCTPRRQLRKMLTSRDGGGERRTMAANSQVY